jgi:large subunit ribosomal protein L30e
MADEEEDTEEISEEVEEATEEKPKKKSQKKVVRRRKTKEKENPLIAAIRLAVESGKTEFGARTGLFAALGGKAKAFVLAANTPDETRIKITEFAKKSNVPVIVFPGNTMELGSVCGKPFSVSVLSIYDPGNSNILKLK